MALYPFPETLQGVSQTKITGNFGLWYNKFIPLSNVYKPADESGNETVPVEHYLKRYRQMKNNAVEQLRHKHKNMSDYCASFSPEKYEIVNISAMLVSPLITGIGESHPHEVSMVFDHNLGIPYIPAPGIKGIIRFCHTIGLIPEACKRDAIDEKGFFDDEEAWTLIPAMFGTQKNRGRLVFLDAYPENVPDLHVDIMNPHYGPYYSDDKKESPPADHHNPTPIKFLTVAKGTNFIFRAIAERKDDMPEKVRSAFIKALTEEGVGAKTAVGYGRFEIVSSNLSERKNHDQATLFQTVVEVSTGFHVNVDPSAIANLRPVIQEKSPSKRLIEELALIKPTDMGRIGTIIQKIEGLESDDDKIAVARAVRDKIGSKAYKKHKRRNYLESLISGSGI